MSEKNWHDKYYKKMLIIPAIVLIFSLVYLVNFNIQNGDIIYKDVSITGGTTITVFDSNVNIDNLKESLREKFPDISIRGISDIRTGKQQAFFIETTATLDEIKPALETYLDYELDSENSSVEFTGKTISSSFYKQLQLAVIIAFAFMAIVVFLIFRTPVPSLAVIISAFADIAMTLMIIDLFKFKLATGGIVAILMLIGYSVDTDILLTTRILRKREGTLNERMYGAIKTGLTMTLTSIIALSTALIIIYSFSEVLRQMFIILLTGLGLDIFNTWATNASILKWYALSKGIR